MINDYKNQVETLNNQRETLITEETTSRTELTYTSQTLKKTETYIEHLKETKIITDTVINNKNEKITEEKTKKEIIDSQIHTFQKKQELNTKIEDFRQFNSTIHHKINNNKKLLEEYTNNYNSAVEDLRTSNTTRHTYEEELKNTKDTKVIEELKSKITTITNTINEQTKIVE
jgi:chromosome segregation ATPase